MSALEAQLDAAQRGDRCEWCDRPAAIPAILPYLFFTRAGAPAYRWLHASCSRAAHARYLEKRAEWAARAAMFDG